MDSASNGNRNGNGHDGLRNRRGFLHAALATAGGILGATMLARPNSAQAGHGGGTDTQALHLGANNDAANGVVSDVLTKLTGTVPNNFVLEVFNDATGLSAGSGISGKAIGGPGVKGQSFADGSVAAGFGVFGISEGEGVRGTCTNAAGTGVVAENTAVDGVALEVFGKAKFSTVANAGSIPTGADTFVVSNTNVTAVSHISVTLTANPTSRTAVSWIDRNPGVGFTLHLTARVATATTISYSILEPTFP